jgi:hypothetical protein
MPLDELSFSNPNAEVANFKQQRYDPGAYASGRTFNLHSVFRERRITEF